MALHNAKLKLVVVIVVCGLFVLFTLSFDKKDGLNATSQIANDNVTAQAAFQTATLPAGNEQQTRDKQAGEAIAEKQFITQELAQQISWVATAFAQQALFPHYSMPIADSELALDPEPFTQARVKQRLPDGSGNLSAETISASVDKLRYVVGEPMTVQLKVEGGNQQMITATASLRTTSGRDVELGRIDLKAYGKSANEFRALVDTADIRLDSHAEELLVVIDLQIDAQNYVTTVPFFLSKSSGRLINIGTVKQRDEFLEIPLEYYIEESGYFFVSAYLDDAASGTPLVELQAEGKMDAGSDSLVLKAHHLALKAAGSEGPYKLRVRRSFRGAEPGEGEDRQTAMEKHTFDIADFAFDGYSDTAYVDRQTQERLEALKALSGKK